MKLYKKILTTAGVGLLLVGTSLSAADTSAKEVINKAYSYVASMDKYTFNAIVTEEEAVIDGKQVEKHGRDVSVKVLRPGSLRIDVKDGALNRSKYFDNGAFTMIDHEFGYYGQLKTPNTINGALDFIFDKYGITTPLAHLIYSEMGKRMKYKKSQYFGTMDVDGVTCDYVAFRTKSKEIHVWVATGDVPLVKTFSIIDISSSKNPRMNASLTWDINPNLSNSDFIFSAPKNATNISVNSTN